MSPGCSTSLKVRQRWICLSTENATRALPGNCVIRGCNSGKPVCALFPAAHHRWAISRWRDLPSCSSSLPVKLTGCSAGLSLFSSGLKEPGTKYKGCPRSLRSFALRPTRSPLSVMASSFSHGKLLSRIGSRHINQKR